MSNLIETLFLSLGAVRTERAGSAVSFVLNDIRADFHRPHPDKEALRYRVKDVRKFLEQAGIKYHEHDEIQGLRCPH